MSSAVTTPLGVLALGGAGALLWSAFTGQNPLAELRAVLTSGELPGEGAGVRPVERAPLPTSTEVSRGDAPSTGPTSSTSSSQRVPIGQGSHTLSPAAANAFRRAEQLFGRQIPITDSTRSFAAQAANRARNPDRFGPAEGNAHVEGRAVDVNLRAIGANPQGEPPNWRRDPVYNRLAAAMEAAGWCNFQLKAGTARGRTREPWHWAVGRCN